LGTAGSAGHPEERNDERIAVHPRFFPSSRRKLPSARRHRLDDDRQQRPRRRSIRWQRFGL